MNLIEKLQEIHANVQKYTGLKYKNYHICPHYHYDNLKISAWKSNEDNTKAIHFVIEDGILKIESLGEYPPDIAKEILNYIKKVSIKDELYTVEIKET